MEISIARVDSNTPAETLCASRPLCTSSLCWGLTFCYRLTNITFFYIVFCGRDAVLQSFVKPVEKTL